MKNDYTFFLNHLKLALARKSFFFELPVSKQVYPLMRLLYSTGIVRRYYSVGGSRFRVYPGFRKYSNRFFKIKGFYRASKPVFVSLNSLQLLSRSSGITMLMLETNKGVVDHNQALKLRVGGRLICIVY